MRLARSPYLLHIPPLNRIFQHRSAHKRTDNNDILPMHLLKFTNQLSRKPVADQHTYPKSDYINKPLHKVSSFIGFKLIMRPERIIEGKVPMFFRVIRIKETGSRAHHINTEPTVKILFPLIVWPNSDTNFNTH